MNVNKKSLTLVFVFFGATLFLLLFLFTGARAFQSTLPSAYTDPALKIEIAPDLSYVRLENSQIQVDYGPFFEDHPQYAIRSFVLKTKGNIEQAGAYLDADEFRGGLSSATLVYDGQDKKTVHMEWDTATGSGKIIHEVSIYANRPFLKIDYINIALGVNFVDMGLPNGKDSGNSHIAFGGNDWIRPYVTKEYTPTVGSYYNRYVEDNINDPANGGSLNYNGNFIVGVYDNIKNIGYGRVLPVSKIKIIKLLLDDTHRRGFEFLHFGASGPFTGYLYPVIGGADEVVTRGMLLADGKYGNFEAATFQSDDFKRCTWNNGLWTSVDPKNDATLATSGSQLLFSVPGGSNHEIWGTSLEDFYDNSPRIMQPSANSDFEIETKIDSGVDKKYQMQGVLIQQDDTNFMRFEFHSNGLNTRIYAGRIVNGVGDSFGGAVKDIGPVGIAPLWLRVTRVGDLWTEAYSLDGTNWTNFVTVVNAMTVTKVGLYVGNTADTNGQEPAHTGVFDYFFNTASPIVPEDGNLNSVNVHVVGGGTVKKEPDKADYACNEQVKLTAQPNWGWSFSGWSGDLTGTTNPATLTVSQPRTVTATFVGGPIQAFIPIMIR